MRLSSDSHGTSMGKSWYVYGNAVLPWDSHGTSVGPPWGFHGTPLIPWDFRVTSVGLLWDFYETFTIRLPLDIHGASMGVPSVL